ncbi:alpha/beta hydrolase [Aldersonia sp. NBC_00410]|uniref:alpha/beta fold hydrolase n=1 Tax=Aldersonia sp. NBC_00410 TaxID=2975954 RepID=UPI0022550693|nr:alpha/beta hydrolase [Aldersonia sp. NBC_00410]MCX5043240.1 alpha/beta hydrolase [Aldersonia sp. NBC_00410]
MTVSTISTTAGKRSVAERHSRISTDDGVNLAVRTIGADDADLTVVLLHGHCLRSQSWSYVRELLAELPRRVRIVSYDHRGHGDSDAADPAGYTLNRLARDLHTVLDRTAGTGRVVLVGHSMGGMTALTYTRMYAQEVGNRIAGVALIATAASDLPDSGFGRFLHNPVISWFQAATRRAPRTVQGAKKVCCRVFAPVIRAAEFGRSVNPRVVALANAMHNETPIETMASFLSEFMVYDESAALPALGAVPTIVLCGSVDLMTPPVHSVAMAAAIPGAKLIDVTDAGHAVIMERPEVVAAAIGDLLDAVRHASELAPAA